MGVLQGLTEFLPVSSSGHLVIGSQIIALAPPSLLLDVLLHVGTLLPVLWLYRQDIWEMVLSLKGLPRIRKRWTDDHALRLTLCVLIGSVPTALMGVLLQDLFERLFASTLVVGFTLLVTGGLLMLTRTRYAREKSAAADKTTTSTLTPLRALVVGVAQGFAITPGISRSGSTIAIGLISGVEREMAARFSFILSVPAIIGATLLQLRKANLDPANVLLFGIGMLAAAISGYIALRWVVHTVKRGSLHWFALYVWPLGAAVLLYSVWK